MDNIPQPIDSGPVHLSTKEQNDRRWEEFKDDVEAFYFILGNCLKSTMDMIQEKHGFQASPRQWKTKIREWGFTKYKKAFDTSVMLSLPVKRKMVEDQATDTRELLLSCKKIKMAPPETKHELSITHADPAEHHKNTSKDKHSATKTKGRSTPQWRNGNASLERYINSTTHSVFESLMVRAQNDRDKVILGYPHQIRQAISDWEDEFNSTTLPPISRPKEPYAPLSKEVLSSLNHPHEASKAASQHTNGDLMDNMTDTSSNKFGVTYSISEVTGVSCSAFMVS